MTFFLVGFFGAMGLCSGFQLRLERRRRKLDLENEALRQALLRCAPFLPEGSTLRRHLEEHA